MGRVLTDRDRDRNTAEQPTGTGYELHTDVDFDTDGDGSTHTNGRSNANDAYHNGAAGWLPIGSHNDSYTGEFKGRGHVIANLYLNLYRNYTGLFTELGSTGQIIGVGLNNSRVLNGQGTVGTLVGHNKGLVAAGYARGGSVAAGPMWAAWWVPTAPPPHCGHMPRRRWNACGAAIIGTPGARAGPRASCARRIAIPAAMPPECGCGQQRNSRRPVVLRRQRRLSGLAVRLPPGNRAGHQQPAGVSARSGHHTGADLRRLGPLPYEVPSRSGAGGDAADSKRRGGGRSDPDLPGRRRCHPGRW